MEIRSDLQVLSLITKVQGSALGKERKKELTINSSNEPGAVVSLLPTYFIQFSHFPRHGTIALCLSHLWLTLPTTPRNIYSRAIIPILQMVKLILLSVRTWLEIQVCLTQELPTLLSAGIPEGCQ